MINQITVRSGAQCRCRLISGYHLLECRGAEVVRLLYVVGFHVEGRVVRIVARLTNHIDSAL